MHPGPFGCSEKNDDDIIALSSSSSLPLKMNRPTTTTKAINPTAALIIIRPIALAVLILMLSSTIVIGVLGISSSLAQSAFASTSPHPPLPGKNGKIAFASTLTHDIFVMNADGSGVTKLTNATFPTSYGDPRWSPDGSKIAFIGASDGSPNTQEIFVMKADGAGARQLTHITTNYKIHNIPGVSMHWSAADGKKIVFEVRFVLDIHSSGDRGQIYEVDVDGNNNNNNNSSSSSQVNLSNNRWDDYSPRLSPDGTQIVFASNRTGARELFVMNVASTANGTGGSSSSSNATQLTYLTHGGSSSNNNNNFPFGPDWSPDGSKIIFTNIVSNNNNSQIYSMNADSTGLKSLLSSKQIANILHPHYTFDLNDLKYSPDGTKIAFTIAINPGGSPYLISDLYVMNLDGSGLKQLASRIAEGIDGISWSPDSTQIVYSTLSGPSTPVGVPHDIRRVNADGTGDDISLISGFNPAVHPDPRNPLDFRNGLPSILTSPDWGVQLHSTIHHQDSSTLTINALSQQNDTQVLHVYTKILSTNGTVLERGFTPMNFTGVIGTTYKVSVANYLARDFSNWDNKSTERTRTIDLSSSSGGTSITAFYDTSFSKSGYTQLRYDSTSGKPSLTVNATLLNGGNENNPLHMWTIIKLQGMNQAAAKNNDKNNNTSSATYTVAASNYGGKLFDHWNDGNTHRMRTLTIFQDTTITAFYRAG